MPPEIVIHIGEIHVHYGDAEVLEAIADLENSIMTALDKSSAALTGDVNALIVVIEQLEAEFVALQSENNTGLKAALDASELDSAQQAAILDANDASIKDAMARAQAILKPAVIPAALVFADQTLTVVTGATILDSVEASGGSGAITFASSPPSQNGVSIGADGEVTGAASADGSFDYSVTATDSGTPTPQTVTARVTVVSASPVVVTAPSVVTTALPDAVTGQSYTGSIEFTGGLGPYSVTNAPLTDNGITVATDGSVTGTPTADADSTFSLSGADSSDPVQTFSGVVTLHSATPTAVEQQ